MDTTSEIDLTGQQESEQQPDLGSGGSSSRMEMLQLLRGSACLLNTVEQRGGAIAYSWTMWQGYYTQINRGGAYSLQGNTGQV